MNSESTIGDLRAAISQLEAEKRRIDEQLRALTTTLRYFESVQSEGDHTSPLSPDTTQERTRRSGRAQYPGTSNNLRDAMAEILAAEGPLHRQEIHRRLVSMGMEIPGQSPINNVGAHLSIDARFESLGGGTWQLVEPDDESAVVGDYDESESDEEEDDVPW